MAEGKFDFIIVGGGTAGLVLAARLSEDSGSQVLVIEAGQDQTDDPRVLTPALWPTMVGTESDWCMKTVEQVRRYYATSCYELTTDHIKAELGGRSIVIPQGRLLGGSSALNGLAFTANSKINVDAWAELGNPGWSWSDIFPYYQKSHTLTMPSKAASTHLGLHYIEEKAEETNGPIQLSFPEDIDNIWPRVWLETLTGLNFLMSGDPFSGQAHGGYVNTESIDPVKRQRSYAANAYLGPARTRPNISVVTGATVERVLFDSPDASNVIATGVQYTKDGTSRLVKTRKEIILSAGAFNSPKLLELSGIGDAKSLQQHKITVVVDNPNVGENFQNHVMAGMSVEVVEGTKTLDPLARQEQEAVGAAMEAYSKSQSGPFANSGTYASALLPVSEFLGPRGKDELNKVLQPLTIDPPPTGSFAALHQDFVCAVLASPHEGSGTIITFPGQTGFAPNGTFAAPSKGPECYFTIAALLSYPLSRGSVHIVSPDPTTAPAIDPRYLSHPLDIEILARHLRYIDGTILKTEPLRSLLKAGGKRGEGVPADLQDLEVVKKFVRERAVGAHHPTGTCAMMPRQLGGVVDARLRVHGVKGLRVCDASVVPITPRSNPQATVYALAEKGADLIKEDWGIEVA